MPELELLYRPKVKSMLLPMKERPDVDNLRNYPPEIVKELKELLLSGGSSVADPKRKYFYDLENDRRTFFVYISPATARVTLLATWLHAAPVSEFADCATACE
jgi:hypothetical protein